MKTPLDLVRRVEEKWGHCAGLEETTLIRLSILRDLIREFHAEKSTCLAEGRKNDAQDFTTWEKKLDYLRSASSLEGDLLTLLEKPEQLKRRTRLLPKILHGPAERERFERYDRGWEHSIAAEAASLGWRFWALDAWIQVSALDGVTQLLTDELIPHGVILFCESSPTATAAEAQANIANDLWKGRWWVVLKPRFVTPEFHVNKLPGVSNQPQIPGWKLLFSPERR